MGKVMTFIALAVIFLAPSLAIGVGGGETMYGKCPDISMTNLDHYVKFSPTSILSGAKIVSLVPRYDFDKYFSNFYGFVGSSTKEVSFSLSGIIIRTPFAGDPVTNNSEFYMRFRVSTATQQVLSQKIVGGECTLIVNWEVPEVPIVLENTPITGPKEIIVKKTEKYTVSVPKATTYFTTVSDPLICEIVGAKNDSTVFIKGLKLGQCKIKRDAWIASDPKVQVVTDELSVEVVLSEEAKRAAGVQAAINMLLLPEK